MATGDADVVELSRGADPRTVRSVCRQHIDSDRDKHCRLSPVVQRCGVRLCATPVPWEEDAIRRAHCDADGSRASHLHPTIRHLQAARLDQQLLAANRTGFLWQRVFDFPVPPVRDDHSARPGRGSPD